MDTTEPAFLNPGVSIKPEQGLFDYNDNQTATENLKNLNVFVEHNNNETIPKHEDTGFDGPMFWGDKELDEISPWTEWSDNRNTTDTDVPVYTLTVLNSQEPWNKKKPESNLDFDSFLNILPESESDSSNYFYPEYSPFGPGKPHEVSDSNPTNNNNTWKTNNNTNGDNINDSLLRNALQGKSLHKPYNPCRKIQDATSSYPIPNGSNHIDEILGLSGIDHYGEDYEKIKKIANEVADCAKYGSSVCASDMYTETISHSMNNEGPSSSRCTSLNIPRKPTKKSLPQIPSAKSGTRKERSLHYCTICSKGFKDKYSVNVHVRTHTGEKPFTCNLCGKSFRQKAHLAKHYQTHLAQSQKHIGNGTASSSSGKPRPKHSILESHSIR